MLYRSLIFVCLFAMAYQLQAQEATPEPLTDEEKKEVVDSIGTILDRAYVFPDIGQKIKAHLQAQWKKGAYGSLKDPQEFAQALTTDVRSLGLFILHPHPHEPTRVAA
ncbi:MAG: hypothetical protein AAGD05_12785 [Bacteroidota bacterium]